MKGDWKMPKYSIITPCYTSWEYMSSYFLSLENQSFKDFEVILVDDMSKDDTYEQICNYARLSKLNIKILQTEVNGGPGRARNLGLSQAAGEWVTFIDSDDWVSEDLFKNIENVISHYNVNCVVYDYDIQRGNKKMTGSSVYGENNSGEIPVNRCIALVRNHVIGKVYKTQLCREKHVVFPELRRCEDVAFVCQAIDACGSVYYLKEPLYYYFQRQESLSNDKSLDAEDMEKAYEIINKKLGEKYPKEIITKSIPDLLYGGVLMMCKAGKKNAEIRKFIEKYEADYPEWYNDEIVRYLGRAKRFFLYLIRHKQIVGLKFLAYIHSRIVG